jgi:large subunit ribosomal protein L22
LAFTRKKAALPVEKLLKSAVANAMDSHGVNDVDTLVIDQIMVDEGPALKRFTPRARGRATPIRKRTSHIRVTLREIEG